MCSVRVDVAHSAHVAAGVSVPGDVPRLCTPRTVRIICGLSHASDIALVPVLVGEIVTTSFIVARKSYLNCSHFIFSTAAAVAAELEIPSVYHVAELCSFVLCEQALFGLKVRPPLTTLSIPSALARMSFSNNSLVFVLVTIGSS